MPVFELEANGKTYEVEAPSLEAAASAFQGQAPAAPAPQQGGTNTKEDSAARGLPPLMMPNYWGQELPARWKAPPVSQQLNDVADTALGIPTGVVGGVAGIPGDIEGLGRLLLSPLGVSKETALPTSSQIENNIAGPATKGSAGGRIIGELLSPASWVKGTPAATKLATNAGGSVVQHGVGLTTGAGAESIKQAYQAGKQGGTSAATFLDHMRGGASVSDEAVQMAKSAVEELRAVKNADYKAGIGSTIKGDPTVLDFTPIETALTKAAAVKTFKGQSLSTVAEKARERIKEVVEEWKGLDPAEFHTPEGLDALKQKVGDLIHEGELSSIKPNSPAALIVDSAYTAIKDQIVKQAPGYAKVMKDYMDASNEIREIQKTLSLGKNATSDTSLRKLQSILRNNANTNYGARANAGETLGSTLSGQDLMPALAGQGLNSYTPRGIQGPGAGLGVLYALATGGPAALASAATALALASPRLMGEAAFGLGRVSGGVSDALKNAGIVRGGGGVPRINGKLDPALIGMMTPAILAQLLLSTSANSP